jgi:hypothetical protein
MNRNFRLIARNDERARLGGRLTRIFAYKGDHRPPIHVVRSALSECQDSVILVSRFGDAHCGSELELADLGEFF